MDRESLIAIAGAGSIGCYVGGCLALAGRNVAFLGRKRLLDSTAAGGLRISDLEGRDRSLAPSGLALNDDPKTALGKADVVLVTVKGGATVEMARLIDRFAPEHAVIVSLQNGVSNAERIRSTLRTPRKVIAGMVPFNVVPGPESQRPLRFHRATEGAIAIEAGEGRLGELLNVEGCEVKAEPDIQAVQWGKLLLNLNNALNALSDLPIAEQLSQGAWRKLLADQMDEALGVIRAAGIKPAKLAGAPAEWLPTILRLPDWLFKRVARRMLAIDPQARASMWQDLQRGRRTEIGDLQGAVLDLARSQGKILPLTEAIVAQVRKAEAAGAGSPGLRPEDIRS